MMTEAVAEAKVVERKRKAVNIVAMGASREDYVAGMMAEDRFEIFRDSETWVINYMASVIHCDRVITLDPVHKYLDLPVVKQMCDNALKLGIPVYTSSPHPDYANHVMYPFHKVHECFRSTYFNNTVAYAFALAVAEGYTHIGLFGCDFTYKDYHYGESGRACVEFLIATAAARGVQVAVSHRSTLIDMSSTVKWGDQLVQQPYGFWVDEMKGPLPGNFMHPEQIIAKSRAYWDAREPKEEPKHEADIVQLPRSVG